MKTPILLVLLIASFQSPAQQMSHKEKAGYWAIVGGLAITGGATLLITNEFRRENNPISYEAREGWNTFGCVLMTLGYALECVAVHQAKKGGIRVSPAIAFKMTKSGPGVSIRF